MKCFPLTIAGFLASALLASAQTAAAPAKQINLIEIVTKGGYAMYPLGLLSIAAVVLILMFLFTIRRNAVVSDRFMNTAEGLVRKRDYLGLSDYCRRQGEAMARVTQRAADYLAKNPDATSSEVRELAETEGSRQAGSLHSRITYLSDIGSIAPMVGLLGTVMGMMKAFLEISSEGGKGVRQMQLAAGVSEALITTATGLMISILALVAYSFFRGRVQRGVAELEAAATHLIGMICSQLDREAAGAATGRGPRDGFSTPVPSPLVNERRDLHGI